MRAYRGSTPVSEDLKRCTKCGEEKPLAAFSRDRSRKDGRYPQCKACVRRWQQENAEHLADYNRRWQQANPEKKRAQDRRYRERKRQDPEYRERWRANARRRDRERRAQDPDYRERKRAQNLLVAELNRLERSTDRTERRTRYLAELAYDWRFALRMIARRRTFAAIAIGTLALGIGANTAAFSVVHAVLLRPLPFPEQERLVAQLEVRQHAQLFERLDREVLRFVDDQQAAPPGTRLVVKLRRTTSRARRIRMPNVVK